MTNFLYCSVIKPPSVSLQEDDFPSLVQSGTVVSTPMTAQYVAQPKKHSSFQEEDFPALVSKIKPQKPQGNTTSAWSQAGSKPVIPNNKPVVLPTKAAPAFSAIDPLPSNSAPQSLMSSRRKKKLASLDSSRAALKVRSPVSSDDEDHNSIKTTQEIRAVPTMLEISSLLTVKAGSQPNIKAGKKKKQAMTTPSGNSSHNVELVTHAAHKENVPETKPPDGGVSKNPVVPNTSMYINGYKEKTTDTVSYASLPEEPPKKQPVSDPGQVPEEEEFPALIPKKPPPGMMGHFLV